MSRLLRCFFALGLSAVIASCGGDHTTPTSPTAPTPTPAQPTAQNRAPTISIAVSPATWGVDSLTTFTFTASTSDSDGDPVSVTWDLNTGGHGTGPSYQATFTGSGIAHVTATATDGKGGSSTAAADITVGSMSGTWIGSIPGYTNLVFTLNQAGPLVTGTFVEQFFGTGKTDPAAPGRIQADGTLEIRFKLAGFDDFIFRGRLDSTGRRVTGGVYGSGFNGESFTMTK